MPIFNSKLTLVGYLMFQSKCNTVGVTPHAYYLMNPISLRLEPEDTKLVTIAIWMEMGEVATEELNRVYYAKDWGKVGKDEESEREMEKKEKEEIMKLDKKIVHYVDEHLAFLFIRGINIRNYPCLSENEIESMKQLCFAKRMPLADLYEDKEAVNFYEMINFFRD